MKIFNLALPTLLLSATQSGGQGSSWTSFPPELSERSIFNGVEHPRINSKRIYRTPRNIVGEFFISRPDDGGEECFSLRISRISSLVQDRKDRLSGKGLSIRVDKTNLAEHFGIRGFWAVGQRKITAGSENTCVLAVYCATSESEEEGFLIMTDWTGRRVNKELGTTDPFSIRILSKADHALVGSVLRTVLENGTKSKVWAPRTGS